MAQNIIQVNKPVTPAQNAACLSIISDVIALIKIKHS